MTFFIYFFFFYTKTFHFVERATELWTLTAKTHHFCFLDSAAGFAHVRPLNTLFSSCLLNCSLSGAEQQITSLANDVCCYNTLINILHVIILCPLPQQIKL